MTGEHKKGERITLNEIHELVEKAKFLSPPIAPVTIDGKPYCRFISDDDGAWVPVSANAEEVVE